jgi:hypothetical protein
LFISGIVFFAECVAFLSRRDYVASILLFFVGVSVLHVGAELARLALVERDNR